MKRFSLLGCWLFSVFIVSVIYDAECKEVKPVIRFVKNVQRFAFLFCNVNTTTNFSIFYEFYKGNNNITTKQNEHYVNLNPLLTKHSGNYSCSVTINGTVSSSSQVEMKVKLITDIVGNEVIEGRETNLTCTEKKGDILSSEYSVTWNVNGVVIAAQNSPILMLKNVSRIEDKNVYSCLATNKDGETSDETQEELRVYWNDPPVLSISYSVLKEGSVITRLFCESKANEPIKTNDYGWFKDGERITLKAGSDPAFLFIHNITRKDTANYTCSYSTLNITRTSKPKSLIVLYMDQPQIRFLDNTTSIVIEGEKVVFSCQVHSYYPRLNLSYTWYKNSVALSHQAIYRINATVRSDSYLEYECIVTGSFLGNILTSKASVQLDVHYPPKGFTMASAGDIQLINSSYIRPCSAIHLGKPVATMYIYKNGNSVPYLNGTQGRTLQLTLDPLQPQDAGNYTCTAVNYLGTISNTFELIVAVPPGPPKKIECFMVTQWRIDVRWLQPDFVGIPKLNKYHVEYARKDKGWSDVYLVANVTQAVIWSLQNGTEYLVRVRALNDYGPSVPSHYIEVVTLASIPPYTPTELKQVLPALHQAIMVEWNQPPGPAPPYGYYLASKSHQTDKKNFIFITNLTSNYTIDHLDTYTGYDLELFAVNIYGKSPIVKLNNVFTSEAEPEAVRVVLVFPFQTKLFLVWNPPRNFYGVFQYYSVCHEIAASGLNHTCFNVTMTMTNITGLQPNHLYAINITVHNNLYSKTHSSFGRTAGTAPPPLETTLPEPAAEKIKSTSFTLNIVLFNETNGGISHYDVIAMPVTDNSMLSKDPNTFSNRELMKYVVGRLSNPSNNQQFVVGSGQTAGRIMQALGTPNNPPLKENTVYATFVRAYVTNTEYQSTPWYKQVRTKKDDADGLSKGAVAGIVLGVIIAISILVIFILLYLKPRDSKTLNMDMKEYHQK